MASEQPGRLHHAMDVRLPFTNCGIATCPIRATDTTGLSPARLQPCRPLPRPVLEDFPHTVPRSPKAQRQWLTNQATPRLAHNFAIPETALLLEIVDYPGLGKWKGCSNFLKLHPADSALVRTTAQPVPPCFLGKFIHYF